MNLNKIQKFIKLKNKLNYTKLIKNQKQKINIIIINIKKKKKQKI